MITVTVKKKNHYISEVTISGHAQSGPYGFDLVCAGVSSVSFGAVNAIYHLCELELLIERRNEGGYLHIAIPDDIQNEQIEKVQLLLKSMIISLQTIEREYSQFITIKGY